MNRSHLLYGWLGFTLVVLLAVSCAPGIPSPETPVATSPPVTSAPAGTLQPSDIPVTPAPTGTLPPEITPTSPFPTTTHIPTATLPPEPRQIEAEWPASMRLGDSDIVRLALIPSGDNYVAQVEYPEHTIETAEVEVPYLPSFDLFAVARLDAAGLETEPRGDQVQLLIRGSPATWRWTIYPRSAGQHRMHLSLALWWEPLTVEDGPHETVLWQGGLEVQVEALMGLATPQARALGISGILLGGILVFPLAEFTARQRLMRTRSRRVRTVRPNPNLSLEGEPAERLMRDDEMLLRGLFASYDRLVMDTEFTSGYSGARTWLVQPILLDGRSEAHTIAKIGTRQQITSEYANFEAFVRHTLPAMTGRVQGPPVVIQGVQNAALQYTFVGAPGAPPISLRAFSLSQPPRETARMIEERLFGTFGPAWWMQRRPYTFTLGQEYDSLLPVQLLLEPHPLNRDAIGIAGEIEELVKLDLGDVVCVRRATVVETRPSRGTVTLAWPQRRNSAWVRIRIQDVDAERYHEGQTLRDWYGRVVAKRKDLLRTEAVRAIHTISPDEVKVHLGGRDLPNPLLRYDDLLKRRVRGTRSVIHGDLNLENVLVGPGDIVWLIDFAATREGHTLFDLARLEVELTTQVVAERFGAAGLGLPAFLGLLDRLAADELPENGPVGGAHQLLGAVRRIAHRCLYDPADKAEWRVVLALAYLGTLKFANLDSLPSAPLPKALAFAAAAHTLQTEGDL